MLFTTIILQAATNAANELVSVDSTKTLAGCTAIIIAVGATAQRLMDKNPAWLAFICSFALSIATVLIGNDQSGQAYFLAVLNSFIIFTSAAGTTEAFAPKNPPMPTGSTSQNVGKASSNSFAGRKRSFFTSWFRA